MTDNGDGFETRFDVDSAGSCGVVRVTSCCITQCLSLTMSLIELRKFGRAAYLLPYDCDTGEGQEAGSRRMSGRRISDACARSSSSLLSDIENGYFILDVIKTNKASAIGGLGRKCSNSERLIS